MQTRWVVPQTLKSKWGMEKHSNSSCLSDFLRDRFGCLYYYPRCAANLLPKATNFFDSGCENGVAELWFLDICIYRSVAGLLAPAFTAWLCETCHSAAPAMIP